MINLQAPVAPPRALKWALSNGPDLAERALLTLVFGWFVVRMIPAIEANYLNALVAAAETFVVLMVLIRRPGPISVAPLAWVVASIGTFTPLFVVAQGEAVAPGWLAGMLMLVGLLISCAAKLHLNFSFGIVAANRGVKKSGPYRLVRHPMYLGYALNHAGFVMLHPAPLNIAIYTVTWIAMAVRVQFEEQFLRQDPSYVEYAESVRYRLLPGLF